MEAHEVDIPLPPTLFYGVGRRAQAAGVDTGGVYDDKLATIAVYDRPWAAPDDRGSARLAGMIFVSTRTDRVERIEVNAGSGATLDDLLAHLEHLTGLDTSSDR